MSRSHKSSAQLPPATSPSRQPSGWWDWLSHRFFEGEDVSGDLPPHAGVAQCASDLGSSSDALTVAGSGATPTLGPPVDVHTSTARVVGAQAEEDGAEPKANAVSNPWVDTRVTSATIARPVGQTVLDGESQCAHSAQWSVAQRAQIGRFHKQVGMLYEDCAGYRFMPDGGLYLVVCDGVGGGARGDVCAQTLSHYVLYHEADRSMSKATVESLMRGADRYVQQALERHSQSDGASLVAAVWNGTPEHHVFTHVGDCRIYRWQWAEGQARLQRMTEDQTFGALGEVGPDSPKYHHPAYMVGIKSGEPPVREFTLSPAQDVTWWGSLLCSDGIHVPLDDQHLEAAFNDALAPRMAQVVPGNTAQMAAALQSVSDLILQRALDVGTDDDATVLLAATPRPLSQLPVPPLSQ